MAIKWTDEVSDMLADLKGESVDDSGLAVGLERVTVESEYGNTFDGRAMNVVPPSLQFGGGIEEAQSMADSMGGKSIAGFMVVEVYLPDGPVRLTAQDFIDLIENGGFDGIIDEYDDIEWGIVGQLPS